MDIVFTVLWAVGWILGAAIVITLIVVVLKNIQTIRQTVAGWNMPGLGGWAHWDKVVGTVAAMLTVFMVIWMFDWMFPNLSAAYYKHGGWKYELLIPIATFILIAMIWQGKVRKTLLWVLGTFTASLILFALLPAIWDMVPKSDTTPKVASRVVRQAPRDPCDNIYKPYIVYPKPSVITYETGCFVGVNVISEEPVILIGDDGQESEPIYADSPDKALSFRIVKWKTFPGQVAHVEARLYRN